VRHSCVAFTRNSLPLHTPCAVLLAGHGRLASHLRHVALPWLGWKNVAGHLWQCAALVLGPVKAVYSVPGATALAFAFPKWPAAQPRQRTPPVATPFVNLPSGHSEQLFPFGRSW
jgi:hypothetical protein